MVDEKKIRVLVAKPGLDGDGRGAKVVARALRDYGMEVIYTGLRQTPEMIAQSASQEDVDVVGLSILSGAHLEVFPLIVEQLRKKKLDNVLVIAGGIIPEEDQAAVQKIGIKAVFGPGTSTKDIAEFIKKTVSEKKAR